MILQKTKVTVCEIIVWSRTKSRRENRRWKTLIPSTRLIRVLSQIKLNWLWMIVLSMTKNGWTLSQKFQRELFIGHNLFQWSNYITRQLSARNLMNHLTNEKQKIEDKNYFKWIGSETFLHGWLLDSMIPIIAHLLKFETSCKEVWEVAHKRYSKKEDESKIYELVSSTYGIKQGQNSVIVYANELVAISKELDHYRPPNLSSIDREYILRDRVYLFLLGLNSTFENFRGQIFNRPSKVSLEDVITLAIHEESRLILQNRLPQGLDQRSNLAFLGQSHDKKIQPNSQLKRALKSQTPYPKDSLWSTHCKKKRHTKETCWDIHGRPNKFGKSLVTYEESNQEICQAPTQAPDLHQPTYHFNYNLNELEHIKEVINSLTKNNSTSIQEPVPMANLGKCLHSKTFFNSSHD